ncbi:STAS domain-containing protein [Modestobacter lapidis]
MADDLLSVDVAPGSADGMVAVSPTGEIDCVTAPVLRSVLLQCLTSGCTQIVVDLAAVTFLNSAGLTVLAEAHHRAAADGIHLELRGGSRTVRRSLQITRLRVLMASPGS